MVVNGSASNSVSTVASSGCVYVCGAYQIRRILSEAGDLLLTAGSGTRVCNCREALWKHLGEADAESPERRVSGTGEHWWMSMLRVACLLSLY